MDKLPAHAHDEHRIELMVDKAIDLKYAPTQIAPFCADTFD
jgi:hypothetical protein